MSRLRPRVPVFLKSQLKSSMTEVTLSNTSRGTFWLVCSFGCLFLYNTEPKPAIVTSTSKRTGTINHLYKILSIAAGKRLESLTNLKIKLTRCGLFNFSRRRKEKYFVEELFCASGARHLLSGKGTNHGSLPKASAFSLPVPLFPGADPN